VSTSLIHKLNRPFNRRRTLVRGLANDLIMYEKVDTTLPRAKATQSFIERLITKSKEKNLNNKRQVEKALGLDNTVEKMFDVIGPKFKTRPGGYTRILKMGNRRGDNSVIARLEFSEIVSTPVVEEKKEVVVAEKKSNVVKKVLQPKKVTVKRTTKKVSDAKTSKKAV
jgi:large subunit ribosomal protein L17